MTKLFVLWELIKFLFWLDHPNGIKSSVNIQGNGQLWFLVEPAVIWLDEDQAQEQFVTVDKQQYVRVGGGSCKGQYVPVGTLQNILYGDNNDL